MEEKKEIKVKLSTVVYLFIILVLTISLGVVYYLGFVKEDNANNEIVNGEVTEKNNISVNEQVIEVNNNVEEKIENNESERNLNKYKGKEAINMIAKEETKFVIDEIKNNGNTYIITAYILEEQPREILEVEYKNILKGQEIVFRNVKWKYYESEGEDIYLKSTQEYNNNESHNMIALRKDYENQDEKTRYFTNVAGVGGYLSDFSNIKVEFEVSKDIKVCSFFGEFEYVNGKLVCKNIDDETIETTAQTIDTLIDFRNNNEPGTCGTYEECIAYISNGKVDAIKIFEK